ncbi:hypothetical protein LCGC14_0353440 [marine sediment metagenome]|uniref:HNH nuclease domain-containing protein n=1 Tax=marine sediment metagenome TaxID=412755 RepID=A0A0F9TT31_9ZZZZ
MRQRSKGKPPATYYDNNDKSCRWCGGPLTGRKTRFCKPECNREFWVRRNWTMLKRYVHERDDWTCQLCGTRRYGNRHNDADHIIPISDGGDEFEPDNVRTLCHRCHKKVTREWQRTKALNA